MTNTQKVATENAKTYEIDKALFVRDLGENVWMEVHNTGSGFAVVTRDRDAGEALPTVPVFPTIWDAKSFVNGQKEGA